MIASDYPFLDVFWTMFIFFIWILWFMLLFNVWGDLFRRDDLSGFGKTGWFVFTIILPFLGVFIYLLTQNDGMSQRAIARAQGQQAEFDDHVRSVAGGGGAAAEIERAKQLLDSGAISQAEYDAIKQKALA
jgi:hypothetical protein